MNIDPRLLKDCHFLFERESFTLLLHRNADYPWFILVPNTSEVDFLDMDISIQTELLSYCNILNNYIKSKFKLPKTNFASIGNVVSQMHLHIIGRSQQDTLWPKVVWGNVETSAAYSPAEIKQIRDDIESL